MPDVERTVTTTAPLSTVFTYLSDFTNTEEWDPPTVRTTRESGDGGPGTVYRNVSKILGHETEVEYTVEQVVPDQLFQLRGKATGVELLDTMTFESVPEGTKVTYHAEFMPQGAAKLGEFLLPPALKKLGDDTAESLEKALAKLG
ncbi:hypothetical protein ASD11_15780 [Aeromicrobium sp. Root495]|uniref:SRPBCC family protein n=1 Tax=Aeromicrobium sp. Root495 TaxID=1736550 RepID=UPI0006FB5A4F|nr:SRPBCC family protein [Aeromicrobium sp. Root495]KQY55945.1 hypothetical protein ASD11_15780 [Aeromicrobium sp. Root495]